jgi:hypothetical protein
VRPTSSGLITAAPPATDPAAVLLPDPAAAVPAPEPAPAPAPAPARDAAGRLLCGDDVTALTAFTGQPVVASGAQAVLGLRVTNTGAQPCVRDVSGSLQVFTVLGADGSHTWSTADCFPGEGTEVRELAPGESVEFTVRWSGTTSQPGCVGPRTPVAPGSYALVAAVGGLASAPAPFAVG